MPSVGTASVQGLWAGHCFTLGQLQKGVLTPGVRTGLCPECLSCCLCSSSGSSLESAVRGRDGVLDSHLNCH